MTAYSPGNPFAQTKADPAPEADTEAVTDAVERVEMGDGVTDLRAVRLGVDAVPGGGDAGALAADYRNAATLDEAVECVRALKEAQGVFYAFLGDVKSDLWATYGVGKHATESGRAFSFTAPSGSRSCNYADLEAKYPDAYDECVTKKAPKADAVGALRLPKGDLK